MISNRLNHRRGAIAVLTALLLVVMLCMVAFAFDFGWILMTRTQLQAAADSAALAAGTALPAGLGSTPIAAATVATNAGQLAQQYASWQRNGDRSGAYVDTARDFQIGWAVFNGVTGVWDKTFGAQLPVIGGYNMVRVTMHRDIVDSTNADAPLPLIFGRAMGVNTSDLATAATAVIMPAKGIRIESGSAITANVIPFSINEYIWLKYLLAQRYFDANSQVAPAPANILVDKDNIARGWFNVAAGTWHNPPAASETGTAPTNSEPLFGHYQDGDYVADFADEWYMSGTTPTSGTDTKLEIDIYPRDDYTAGNFGTIDIGSSGNSTNDIERQILTGISDDDLAYYPPTNVFAIPRTTTGDTGISAGFKDALDDVAGLCRAVFLFRGAVVNPGNNATFSLASMAGVRVMHTELTGSLDLKHLKLQRCDVTLVGGIGDYTTQIGKDTTVFTPLILIE